MKILLFKLAGALFLCITPALLNAQSAPQQAVPSSPEGRAILEQKLGEISSALTQTREQLERSQRQMDLLQAQLLTIQKQLQPAPSDTVASSSSLEPTTLENSVTDLHEQQDILKSQVKILDQAKVESASKYPVRLTGLILFNAFANRGTVENLDVPEVALAPTAGVSNVSVGAGLRQTILGIEGVGPIIAGARTFADVNLDFFAGLSYGNFGTSAGTVRMRTASINMAWKNTSLQAGLVNPLISPLSPTSYATVAQPGLAWAGNLWTWAPQLRIEHRIQLPATGDTDRSIGLEFGLWDAPSAGFSTNELVRTPTAGELSKQPAYEGRVSFAQNTSDRKMQFGLGGYYARQSYSTSTFVDSWAATADWLIPLSSRFELSGEAYRGRALGGLGGGVYKDVLLGTSPVSGLGVTRGLNAIGGWTQFKTRFTRTFETNASIGQDSGYAGDFHALILAPTTSNLQQRARNRMLVGNLVFRPKTYLIFSPEYRRIWTWPINGQGRTADIFTLSIGYQF